MKKKIIFLLIFISLFSFSFSYAQSIDEIEIRQVLGRQQKAWNTNNLQGFMDGYWKNDSLMFIGKSGITYGWQQTLDTYKKNYPDTAAMGSLTFNLLELKPLSALFYFVIGKWHLQRSGGNLEGHFTLLFKKIKSHWVIIADHSS